ncbi:MAG: hypothetical protein OXF74_13980 [Rhodobacteraceae bacterium]|nr:hypothetical protein [Paracoccaceae bacterium]
MAAQLRHGERRAFGQAEPLDHEHLDPTYGLRIGTIGIKQSAHACLLPAMSRNLLNRKLRQVKPPRQDDSPSIWVFTCFAGGWDAVQRHLAFDRRRANDTLAVMDHKTRQG